MKRPTIVDIARRAGVSKGTVSFALNGQPGVSPRTRQRILTIARELGWQPSSAARALSGAKVGVMGMAVARSPHLLALEPFYMELISGFEAEFGPRGVGLLLQVVGQDPDAQLEAYRRWWARGQVDGLVLNDLRVDDPRLDLLDELGMPTVMLSRPTRQHPLVTSVWLDERTVMGEVVAYLVALGHREIARVTGDSDFVHTRERTEAFEAAVRAAGVRGTCVPADYSGEQGGRATRTLLSSARPPSAILFDNDVMAVAGLAAATEMGISVPEQLSVVAWDDSPLCQLTHPALTAVHRDVVGYGTAAAAALIELVETGNAATRQFTTPYLQPRGSTGRFE